MALQYGRSRSQQHGNRALMETTWQHAQRHHRGEYGTEMLHYRDFQAPG